MPVYLALAAAAGITAWLNKALKFPTTAPQGTAPINTPSSGSSGLWTTTSPNRPILTTATTNAPTWMSLLQMGMVLAMCIVGYAALKQVLGVVKDVKQKD